MNEERKSVPPSGGTPTHLTKDEMRERIKASLAAKEGLSSDGQPAPAPAYAGAAAPTGSIPDPTRSEKVRQIQDAMTATRSSAGSGYAQPRQSAPRRTAPSSRPDYTYQNYGGYGEETTRSRSGAGTHTVRNISIIAGIAAAVILLIVYFTGLILYHGKFLPNTYVNNTNIAGMTGDEASAALLSTAQKTGITFVPKDGDPITFPAASFGGTTAIPDGSLDEPAEESHGAWFTKLFSKSEYTVKFQESYSEDALASLIAAYDWGSTPPTDAKIVTNGDGSYSIQPESDGNMVDTAVLSDYAIAQMREGNSVIQMADSNCYKKASVTAESLQSTLDLYNKIGAADITFDMTDREEMMDPVGTEVLEHSTILDWVSVQDDEITVDTDKATAWVQENIADKYDTYAAGYTRTFNSTADGTVELAFGANSTYGWLTNVEQTTQELVDAIKAGGSTTLEPIYDREGFRMHSHAGVDYTGATYIEVDICRQHLWFYVNGSLFLDTDVVTGLASDPNRLTPPGVFKIRTKIPGQYLGTYEVEGYHTWVDFWMPIDNNGIGLHDLARSAYGGDIYLTNGSHGCINLPWDMAEKIYNEVTIETPVLIVP